MHEANTVHFPFLHTSLMHDTLLFDSRHFLHIVTKVFLVINYDTPLSFIKKKIKQITYSVHNVEVA